jgi:hypothetical protein
MSTERLPGNFAVGKMDASRNILLLDSDPTRLQARGLAIRQRGANVTCISTVLRARAVWKPGSHDLVLIEFGGAGPEFEEFRRYVRDRHAAQAFGFYTSEPPYLILDVPVGEALNTAPPASVVDDSAVPAAPPALVPGVIAEASRRIAGLRTLTRPRNPEQRAGSLSFSAAVKAAERLVERS